MEWLYFKEFISRKTRVTAETQRTRRAAEGIFSAALRASFESLIFLSDKNFLVAIQCIL